MKYYKCSRQNSIITWWSQPSQFPVNREPVSNTNNNQLHGWWWWWWTAHQSHNQSTAQNKNTIIVLRYNKGFLISSRRFMFEMCVCVCELKALNVYMLRVNKNRSFYPRVRMCSNISMPPVIVHMNILRTEISLSFPNMNWLYVISIYSYIFIFLSQTHTSFSFSLSLSLSLCL